MSVRCSKCSSELPVETTFCPTCGNRLIKSNLGMTSNLILIYGVVAIIIGLFFAAGLSVIDQAWNDIAGPDGTYDGITYDLMVSVVQWTAVAFLSSGVCAAVSGFMSRRLVYGKVCLILCVLASVLVFAAAIPDAVPGCAFTSTRFPVRSTSTTSSDTMRCRCRSSAST